MTITRSSARAGLLAAVAFVLVVGVASPSSGAQCRAGFNERGIGAGCAAPGGSAPQGGGGAGGVPQTKASDRAPLTHSWYGLGFCLTDASGVKTFDELASRPGDSFMANLAALSDMRFGDSSYVSVEALIVERWIDADGNEVGGSTGCYAEPPPPPPPPPSPAEVWASVDLPKAAIEIRPSIPATGMDTKFWAVGATAPISVSVELRGWTATTTARPVKYFWTPGDGRTFSSASPRSGADPLIHMYETKGDYNVELTVLWTGEFDLSGYGVSTSGIDLGSVSTTVTRPVHVREIRSVLVE